MKKIIIVEYLKFQNTDKENIQYENAYRNGYWNVMLYSEELEQFLIRKNIEHKITPVVESLA